MILSFLSFQSIFKYSVCDRLDGPKLECHAALLEIDAANHSSQTQTDNPTECCEGLTVINDYMLPC